MVGFCVDCDRTVEVDQSGKCITCGSASTIPNGGTSLDAITLSSTDIMNAAEEIGALLRSIPLTVAHRAAFQLISARLAMGTGLRIGIHLENILAMWSLAKEVESLQDQDKESHPSYYLCDNYTCNRCGNRVHKGKCTARIQ